MNAFSPEDAQQCITKLMDAYEKRAAPVELFALHRLAAKALGPINRSLTDPQREIIRTVALDLIKDTFKTSLNVFTNIRPQPLQKNGRGHRIIIKADIFQGSTGKKYPDSEIEALLTGKNGCGLWQITIEDVYMLSTELFNGLAEDPRSSPFMETQK